MHPITEGRASRNPGLFSTCPSQEARAVVSAGLKFRSKPGRQVGAQESKMGEARKDKAKNMRRLPSYSQGGFSTAAREAPRACGASITSRCCRIAHERDGTWEKRGRAGGGPKSGRSHPPVIMHIFRAGCRFCEFEVYPLPSRSRNPTIIVHSAVQIGSIISRMALKAVQNEYLLPFEAPSLVTD